MADWKIIGAPAGSRPMVGAAYLVKHARKGAFKIRVVSLDEASLVGEILDGSVTVANPANAVGIGETVRIGDTLCTLTPLPVGG